MKIKKRIIESQKNLKTINENIDGIIVKAKFGPSKETKIPFELCEKLSFLAGAIIGDGHLKKSKFQITIELSNKNLLNYIKEICKDLFNRDFNIYPIKKRKGRKQTYAIRMDSKAIHSLFNKTFEIPSGSKSNLVYVPEIINNSNKQIKSAFLSGIMLTEGGNRRRGFGLSTSSKILWENLINMFNDLDIKVLTDKWIYKKYNKEYYGFYFKKEKIKIISNLHKDEGMSKLLLEDFSF